jgi:sulfur carrier protein ThiS
VLNVGIRVSVRLYNRLERLLPPEAEGRTELDLPEGSNVKDVCGMLGITRHYPVAVNGVIAREQERILEDGDQISVFAPIGGGR